MRCARGDLPEFLNGSSLTSSDIIPWPLTVRPKRYRGRHFPCRTLVQFRANLVCRQYIWQRAVVLADIGDVEHWTQCVILKL